MAFIKNNLITLLVIAACVASLIIYENYFSAPPADVLTSSTATSTSSVGGDLLGSIAQLKAVTLDPSIFSDPVFLSLVDFGVAIPLEPVGRGNPFAPLGNVSSAATGTVAPTNISSHAVPKKTR